MYAADTEKLASDRPFNWIQKLAVKVLRQGPLPRHVAFIMDGNRRYAIQEEITRAAAHGKGFDKMIELLYWCTEMAIPEVTVYAFSIENFKRSRDELDALEALAREKFLKLFREESKFNKLGASVRFIGDMSLIPKDLRKLAATLMLKTRGNHQVYLNIACCYTSRDEIATTMKDISEGVKNNDITVEDINEELVEYCLFTRGSRKLDILFRTSGELRLSDFLMWQVSKNSLIYIHDAFWPEMTLWNFLGAIFEYQRVATDLKRYDIRNDFITERGEIFAKKLENKRYARLQTYIDEED